MSQNKKIFLDFLEPQQLEISLSGGQKLVHTVRMMLENNPNFICIKLDFKNAFNEISRKRILEVINKSSTLKHLATFTATIIDPNIHRSSNKRKTVGE